MNVSKENFYNFFKRNHDQKKTWTSEFLSKNRKILHFDSVFITKSEHKLLYSRVDLRKIYSVYKAWKNPRSVTEIEFKTNSKQIESEFITNLK